MRSEPEIVCLNPTALANFAAKLDDILSKDFWEAPWFMCMPGMPEKIRER